MTPDLLSLASMTAAVLTVSDSCARGERKDASGPAVSAALQAKGFQVISIEVVPDQATAIGNALLRLVERARLVVTTGGTGVAKSDVTPEATRSVCDRLVEGIAERMRSEGAKQNPRAVLSRAVCGIRGTSLVLNLPGSPAGATESLATVVDLLPHALELLAGKTAHAAQAEPHPLL